MLPVGRQEMKYEIVCDILFHNSSFVDPAEL